MQSDVEMDTEHIVHPSHVHNGKNSIDGADSTGSTASEMANKNGDEEANGLRKPGTGARQSPIPTDPDFCSRVLKPVPDYPVADETHYVWEISDWNTFRRIHKLKSPSFKCGGYTWRITIFPKSNSEAMAIYLEPQPPTKENAEEDDSAKKTSKDSDLGAIDVDATVPLDGDRLLDLVVSEPDYIADAEVPKSDPQTSKSPESSRWYACAQFALVVWNPTNPVAQISSAASHRFSAREQDWGFSSYAPPRELVARGILENNKLNISACVRVIDDSSTGVLWHDFSDYDSKQKTGFVGLNNQGATCYLNLLLQLYFVTGGFRALVYDIPTATKKPTTDGESSIKDEQSAEKPVNPLIVENISNLNVIDGVPVTDIVAQLSNSNDDNLSSTGRTIDNKRARAVALAMQRVFAHMQLATAPVSTLELTKSFGWDSSDAFTQHDVQELNRILMDTLELAMRHSVVDNKLSSLFVGAMKSYVKCVEVEYESSRVEPFWDIQLNVRGFQNLHESFENYVEPELLSGDNKYDAGGDFGYQDAKKGVFFQWFPPVLHLQLKRFEYDFVADDLMKIDDMYEYPDLIDLSAYLGDVPDSVRLQDWTYKLHGVLVHQGSVSNGHYYAMLKPFSEPESGTSGWYRFDDDKVWKVTPTQVFHENFGARNIPPQKFRSLSRAEQNEYILRRATSAYMLVYYREECLPTILPKLDITVPVHVQNQILAERKEASARNRQRLEALHYLSVKTVHLGTFQEYSGFDVFPDPVLEKCLHRRDFAASSYPMKVKVRKDAKVSDLVQAVGRSMGYEHLPKAPFSLYTIKPRANRTARPESLITSDMMDETIMLFYQRHYRRRGEDMVVFVYEPAKDLLHSSVQSIPSSAFSNEILLLIKHYDAKRQEVRGLSYVLANKHMPVSHLDEQIRKLVGENDTEFLEEVSGVRIEKLDATVTLEKNELVTGDIITVAKSGDMEQVRKYYDFMNSRVLVRAKHGRRNIEHDFVETSDALELPTVEIWLSTAWTYTEFAKAIASQLEGVNAENLRFFVLQVDPEAESDDAGDQESSHDGKRFPIPSGAMLNQIFPSSSAAPTFALEYEVLKISLAEYERMRSITVHWLKTIVQDELCNIFIARDSCVGDLVQKVIDKFGVDKSLLGGILAWTSVNYKYGDLLKFDLTLDEIPEDCEVCCGYFPTEVAILVDYDMYKRFSQYDPVKAVHKGMDPEFVHAIEDERIKSVEYAKLLNFVPVFHFHKLTNYTHSAPFLFLVFPDEKWPETLRRLCAKLGLDPKNAFDKMRAALADDNDKGRYLDLNAEMVLFDEIGKHETTVSLALDHRDRHPRRAFMQEKGISIG